MDYNQILAKRIQELCELKQISPRNAKSESQDQRADTDADCQRSL